MIRNIFDFFRSGAAPGFTCMFLLGVLLSTACWSPAQEGLQFRGPANDNRPAAALRVKVNEVDLSFLASGRHHHWITDLSANELRLKDNGKPPESIRFFQSRTGLPLRVGLLLDTSDSVAQQFAFEKAAAASFISQIIDPARDLAFVMGFSNTVTVARDFTSDKQALASAFSQLRLKGTTAIYDAVDFACEKLLQHAEHGLSRRVLVVLTDGQDNSSRITPDQLIKSVARCNATVIVLHTDHDPDSSSPEYRVLKKLTSETGGELVRADSRKHLTRGFALLRDELRSYYLLAYQPAEFIEDGSFRKIELKTTRHGAHIICRRGYYAVRK